MKVSELIEALGKLDPDATVFAMGGGYESEPRAAEEAEAGMMDNENPDHASFLGSDSLARWPQARYRFPAVMIKLWA